MTKHHLTPAQQKRLREEGLVADVHEPHITESGLYLDAMPKGIKATRRRRSDRVTSYDAERMGLDPKRLPDNKERKR